MAQKFNFDKTFIEGLYVIEPTVYGDNRGYFMETYNKDEFFKNGLQMSFVQDNQSYSKKGVLRGLHFQKSNPQGKLVRVGFGTVYDVAVDLRTESETYGKWFGIDLSGENKKQLYIPPRFAHGFLVRSEDALLLYKCTEFYNPQDEGGIMWNDIDISVDWKIADGVELILSDKDKKHPSFKNITK